MLHMIHDQIEAYRRAVETRAKAEVNWYNDPDTDTTELRACREEEQLRLDGLNSVIGMVLQDYATQQPFNPFSINGDVNQGVIASIEDALSDDPQPDWRESLSDAADALRDPPTIADTTTSRLEHAVRSDPQVRTIPNGPPPREDI